jgi:hypothetical protein
MSAPQPTSTAYRGVYCIPFIGRGLPPSDTLSDPPPPEGATFPEGANFPEGASRGAAQKQLLQTSHFLLTTIWGNVPPLRPFGLRTSTIARW